MSNITIYNTFVEIDDYYHTSFLGKLERLLSYYDFNTKKYTMHMFEYDNNTHILKVPRGLGIDFIIKQLKEDNISIKNVIYKKYSEGFNREIDINIRSEISPRNELQTNAIKYLTTNLHITQKTVSMDTGKGKTFCSIYSIYKLRMPTIIISGNLTEQWIREICKFTECLFNEDIIRIRGKESIDAVWRKKPKAAFYVASTKTIVSYIENGGDLNKLLEYLNIKIKIIDEVHLNFRANIQIDFKF